MGDRLEIEEEYDCRYEGLDYDGVDFGPVAVFGNESCSSQEEEQEQGGCMAMFMDFLRMGEWIVCLLVFLYLFTDGNYVAVHAQKIA